MFFGRHLMLFYVEGKQSSFCACSTSNVRQKSYRLNPKSDGALKCLDLNESAHVNSPYAKLFLPKPAFVEKSCSAYETGAEPFQSRDALVSQGYYQML